MFLAIGARDTRECPYFEFYCRSDLFVREEQSMRKETGDRETTIDNEYLCVLSRDYRTLRIRELISDVAPR